MAIAVFNKLVDATSRIVCKIGPFRRLRYESQMFEADCLREQALDCIDRCRSKLTQPEFNEWNTVLDVLNAERKHLLTPFKDGQRPPVGAAAISDAEQYRRHTEAFYERSKELERISASRPEKYAMPADGIASAEEVQRKFISKSLGLELEKSQPSVDPSKEQSRSQSAPSKTVVSFALRSKQSSRSSSGASESKAPVRVYKNALGLYLNGQSDYSLRSPSASTRRSPSLRSVLSGIFTPFRRRSTLSVVEYADSTEDSEHTDAQHEEPRQHTTPVIDEVVPEPVEDQ